MKSPARLSSLVAALCLGIPATGFTHDHGGGGGGGSHGGGGGSWHGGGNWHGGGGSHGGNWHGGNWHGGHYYCGPRGAYYGSIFPFYSYYPYYSAPYYGDYYDSYYDSPAIGLSVTTSHTYRGAQVSDHASNLAIDVQRALRRDGYYHGSIDGDIGTGTRGAIRQYQYDHHLEVTGRIDRALLRSLGMD